MNPELVKKALEKVLEPTVLVNLVSQRVRQLARGARPLIADTTNLGIADIALREIIEDKMSFEMPGLVELTRPTGKGRKRPQNWAKHRTAAGGEEHGAKDFPARKRALTHG
jgi:DNA-directed RNA polymerase subunit omega